LLFSVVKNFRNPPQWSPSGLTARKSKSIKDKKDQKEVNSC